ncbi:MAG: hypothetical protein ACOC1G_03265 [Phycisphaeraceae bacterium]
MSRSLRDALRPHLEGRWDAFAQAHPHLAQAIDRVKFEEVMTRRVREDEAFRRAMEESRLDEATLAAAAEALERARGVVERAMPW